MSAYHRCNEEQLLASLRLGDHAAFTEIYNRYWEVLADAAYQRLRSREDAEEVVQEIFVNLYLRRKDLNPKSTLEAYLKQALKYKVIDAYRLQQQYYQRLQGLIEEHKLALAAPDQQVELKELKQRVLHAADKLPDKCREVFIMSRFHQLSHQEISDRTGISISTIKKHIHKALQILRHDFKDNQLDFLLIGMFIFLK
ncbi:RNA polymerase sigma factor [Olivibacter sp. XZL3]|uniref:RNA polymerase sigma factor n=1 Tax=Olivibacter sp. XZL3 TaxID=1735116 RepID=UPI0010668A05|nr:RNA polymerase sigma-70 factor [Olivibacter sp. XZL3]